jgi:hypothetical protein
VSGHIEALTSDSPEATGDVRLCILASLSVIIFFEESRESLMVSNSEEE